MHRDHLTRLRTLIAADDARMRILRFVRELDLPDCWVAAGFIRSAVWDHLHDRKRSPLPEDIDVVWHDAHRPGEALDAHLEEMLSERDRTLAWSVKNQARMHLRNGDTQYADTEHAMRHWPETATAVGARLDKHDRLWVLAPYGLADLFGLVVRPPPGLRADRQAIYWERAQTKRWRASWPRLNIQQAPGVTGVSSSGQTGNR